MILIADSGSTKTHWRLINDTKNSTSVTTQGINPYFQSEEDIFKILKTELLPSLNQTSSPLNIFFYGAGCGTPDKNKTVSSAISKLFPNSAIEVNNDLLAAARALCGNNKGIAAILGTGSNTCYYDGKKIAEHPESSGLGYILGDEGSGAHMGLTFIKAYLNKELPANVADKFYRSFKLDKADILDAVYKRPMPNKFLASFSLFIYENISEPFLVNLVTDCLNQFFDKHICKYAQHKNVNLNCVGSVAFYYTDLLKKVSHTKGVTIGKIIANPIDDLALYHLEHLQK